MRTLVLLLIGLFLWESVCLAQTPTETPILSSDVFIDVVLLTPTPPPSPTPTPSPTPQELPRTGNRPRFWVF